MSSTATPSRSRSRPSPRFSSSLNKEIPESYLDAWGRETKIDPSVREALARALEPASSRAGRGRKLRMARGPCYQPELLERGGRVWGFSAQLYGLRSSRNWGIGDFGDLKALVELAARLGAALVGVSPLHATQGSPYFPSSRQALNFLYLDVEAIPEFAASRGAQRLVRSAAFQQKLAALREAELVDYAAVAQAKLEVLELVFQQVRAKVRKPSRFAIFEALRERHGGGWQNWPSELRRPESPEVREFARSHARRVAFFEWLQRRARVQLDAVQRRARALGMPIGLYVDLALGADRGGAEVWAEPDAFAVDVSCGAPPDEFAPRGQNWGLPPYSPRALRASAYRPFRELLRANMPKGGALRMDHVMALTRLWWIPPGEKADRGGYVNYSFADLLGILAEQSRSRRCLVIGEDLGTVPAELRRALGEAGVLSYRPLFFEKRNGEFAPPGVYPREALVCLSTHDLPTWRGYWMAHDVELRRRLGLAVDAAKDLLQRKFDQEKLARALEREGLDTSVRSAHAFIARTPCKIATVQPEDVFELMEQANLPGTVDQHPNWRRKLPVPLEKWSDDARVRALASIMAERCLDRNRASPPLASSAKLGR
jgi:(1->4)-alpha-D-glucan 1-alpha-D-glucosylmutase